MSSLMLQHFQVRGLIEGKDEQKKTHKLVQKTLVELKKREKKKLTRLEIRLTRLEPCVVQVIVGCCDTFVV
jgi:hypothetical protein